MSEDIYSIKKFSLQFHDEATESLYKDHILDRTLWFCRITWGFVFFLGSSFGLLDRYVFGANADIVLVVRFTLVAFSALILALTFSPRFKSFMDLSSSLFIISVGPFCTFLTAMGDPATFSPYFTGLVYAFTGILSTAGLGFKYSFYASLANLAFFEIVLGLLSPVNFLLFVVYNFFLISILLIFLYIGYFIEVISRKNFIFSAQLFDSLSKVKKLSGLLPICASCKKIRDDKGYWKQIETYIRDHSEADFSHSICPECAIALYPDVGLHNDRTV